MPSTGTGLGKVTGDAMLLPFLSLVVPWSSFRRRFVRPSVGSGLKNWGPYQVKAAIISGSFVHLLNTHLGRGH